MSTALIFIAIQKIIFLNQFGLEPYRKMVVAYQLPNVIALYGILALIIELVCIVGLWLRKIFSVGVFFMLALTTVGVGLSVWSLIFKLQSECGCGLFGDDEYFILAQKILILLLLIILYRGRDLLFPREKN
ncbi:MAG: hypothetical protein K9M49_01305 [Candidatus Marinimicrobia bacterium]|nr:hypothetical protein [Candidatus Neomarinimicrobiota bacterium]MCF7903764.1 hypothetical protein [Candidatus Neomarinimicrobiota bacterium]